MEKIRISKKQGGIVEALKVEILSGNIPVGTEMTQNELAESLGVSRMPVREAFQILARDGLIELEQNKAAVVLGVNEKTIREHYQNRAVLESEACVLCCENGADLSAVKNCLDASVEAFN